MRVRGLRDGTRFVLEDKGGIWEKVSDTRARCVFGNRDDYGRESDVDPDAFAFGLFDRPGRGTENRADAGTGLKVVILDDDTETVLVEYRDVGAAMVAALTATEMVRIRLPRARKKRQYMVMDTCLDPEDVTLCILAREDKSFGQNDDDDKVSVPPTAKDIAAVPKGPLRSSLPKEPLKMVAVEMPGADSADFIPGGAMHDQGEKG